MQIRHRHPRLDKRSTSTGQPRKNRPPLVTAALILLLAAAPSLASDDFLPPDQAFQVTAEASGPDTILVRWDIADGYYLYQERFRFASATPDIETRAPQRWPPAETKQDEYFGQVQVYRERVAIEVPLRREGGDRGEAAVEVTYQGCADAGLCYPPQHKTLRISLPAAPASAAAPSEAASAPGTRPVGAGSISPLSEVLGTRNADAPLPAEQAFVVSATAVAPDRLRVTWDIAKGTYLYKEGLTLALEDAPGVILGDMTLPAGEVEANAIRPDGKLGAVALYRGRLEVTAPLRRSRAGPVEVTLVARYQGCADLGFCYPPQSARLAIALPAATASPTGNSLEALPRAAGPAPTPVSETDELAATLAQGKLWVVIPLFFGFGLLLSLTPCVFPMIPILSGIIAGQGDQITTGRAFALSLIYVLAMALTYTAAGVLAGLFGANLQAAFQNAWILSAFALVFVALALSMFGLYELQLPSGLQTRLAELSRRQEGGTFAGVAIMGLLSALIVGPCVAPPLAGALIFIGQTGDALLGGLALFALSLGMGVPLIAIGTTAGKLLPRAGAWMNTVKAVFGVLLLAVAIWLLERVLAPAIAMALWGLLLIASAVYLGALQATPATASGWSRLWQGLGLALLIYGALMLVGAAGGGKDTLQPLRGLGFGGGGEVRQARFKPIDSVADLDREIAAAAAAGRPVMLDFYADWCVACKELERYTFSDPAVVSALDGFVLLKADVTGNDAADRALLQGRFGLPGPPAIIFFDREGHERRAYRIIGFEPPAAFLEHLRSLPI